MAQVLGESGRFASQEAVRKQRARWTLVMLFMGLDGFIMGFLMRGLFPRLTLSSWACVLAAGALALLAWAAGTWTCRRVEELDKERANWQRGADGEDVVGRELGRFPGEFRVINDLTTPFGNLDHAVVGPTGVFLLDTKNWRGVVSADGQGELLLNGKPPDKPCVRPFLGRVMGIKEKARALVDLDPYFQAVLVFTSARVEANWGSTKSVHCLRDEQLFDYIVASKPGKRLTTEEVDKIAQALAALAHLDKDFTEKAGGNGRPRISAIVQTRGDKKNPPRASLTPSYTWPGPGTGRRSRLPT